MNNEDLERTGIISRIIADDEVSMEERLMEILDKIEYNDKVGYKELLESIQ